MTRCAAALLAILLGGSLLHAASGEAALELALTYADTKYRDNLVGADGRALTNALFQLPGRRVSNAPAWTVTS